MQVAQAHARRPPAEVVDELGDHEVDDLPRAGVVERPCHDDRQVRKSCPHHQFHRDLAHRVMVGRGRRLRLGDRRVRGIAVHVGAARDHDALEAALRHRVQQVQRAEEVHVVERAVVLVADETDRSQVHQRVGLQ